MNVLLLGMLGYSDPRFLTFNQARARGGSVKRGERGCPIVFWKFLQRRPDDGPDGIGGRARLGDGGPDGAADAVSTRRRTVPMLRHFTVFNVTQTEGCDFAPLEATSRTVDVIADADALAARYLEDGGPSVGYRSARAFYAPSLDAVSMPSREAFESSPAF